MGFLQKIKQQLSGRRPQAPATPVSPADGYDLWSATYDEEPGNLMIALDEAVFRTLAEPVPVAHRVITDIGCGTGRHWAKLLAMGAQQLIGYDVSAGMLEKLRNKFPDAIARQISDCSLPEQPDQSVDIVISTLALAHMPDVAMALKEWHRILKPGGHILLTDYHPAALEQGATVTFAHHQQTVRVQHYIYPLETINALATQLGLQLQDTIVRVIDDRVKDFYATQNALPLYRQFYQVPILYGVRFYKPVAA